MMTYDASGKWYHGSPLKFKVLLRAAQSHKTVTWRAFFRTNQTLFRSMMMGILCTMALKPGYLYEIAETLLSLEDVIPHPRTTMRPGDEWLITRPLKVTLLCETRPDPQEFLSTEDIAKA